MLVNGADVEALFAASRAKLHRYCARMTGSVIDGEDVVQETLVRALTALPNAGPIVDPDRWLFRLAHNAAVDFLRRGARIAAHESDADPDSLGDPHQRDLDPDIVAASLRTFMLLPASQRSAVVLMDVLGYRLHEICDIMHASLPAVKSALHRGRARLRELARGAPEIAQWALSASDGERLQAYVDRFNAADFDAIRDLLAEDVQLEMVGAARRNGRRQVASYVDNYSSTRDWHLSVGHVEGRAAVLVDEPGGAAASPSYFVLIAWRNDRIASIRDFRYARYSMDGAEIGRLSPPVSRRSVPR